MRARVFVTLKPSVFDPQGRTIVDALHSLGYGAVGDVRQGKYFELDINTSEPVEARALAAEVADRLLANPVIESYRIEVDS
jgi:phosphoribosylformylglycinamidine synthase